MYTITVSRLLDGEMFSDSYTYYYFCTTMNAVADIMTEYRAAPMKDGDCWSITVFYGYHTILTLNSDMF